MSCIVLSARPITAIAAAITKHYNYGFGATHLESFELSTRDDLCHACKMFEAKEGRNRSDFISESDLFKALFDMNVRAHRAAYPGDNDDVFEPTFPHCSPNILTILPHDAGRFDIPDAYFQLLKWVRSYLYQCSEGEVLKYPLYRAVQEFSTILTTFIVTNNPAYFQASWL